MINRFSTAQSTGVARRLGVPALVTLALTVLAGEAAARQPRPSAPTEATAPREAGEPIMAIVSIKSQQVTFYDADGWIFRAPVSTGTTGRETPAGIFALLEKDKDHHSTLYDYASMPNMQRITWNGIALHGGPLPGYAASHGCVRMPYDFAENLFDKTRIGMRVIISPIDAAPVEFSHPALFMPMRRRKAPRPPPGHRPPLRRRCASWKASRAAPTPNSLSPTGRWPPRRPTRRRREPKR
jgi:L,D-transpeptidase catalytic domain